MAREAGVQQLQLEEAILEPPPRAHDASSPNGGREPKIEADAKGAAGRPSAAELLTTPGALLTRSHLRRLGLERRAVDAVFRALPLITLPGYSRPMIRAEEYLELLEEHTYRDDRVRPCRA